MFIEKFCDLRGRIEVAALNGLKVGALKHEEVIFLQSG